VRPKIIVIILLVFIALTGCTAKTQSDAYQNSNYINSKYGFSLNIPKDFAEDVNIKEEANIVYFIYKVAQNLEPNSGKVGRIEIYDKKHHSESELKQRSEMYSFRYIGENKKYFFGWAHATDVQVPPYASNEIKENFIKLEKRFEEVITKLILRNRFLIILL
jgi:hypothetical protein